MFSEVLPAFRQKLLYCDVVEVQLQLAYGVELFMEHAANYTAHGENEKVGTH